MLVSATIDSRLVPACLSQGGLSPTAISECRATLAEMLAGRRASPSNCDGEFNTPNGVVRGSVTLNVLWDAVQISIDCDDVTVVTKALESFSKSFDPGIQEQLKGATSLSVRELDAHLKSLQATIEGLRNGSDKITLPVAQALIGFHAASIDRVIHEEIVGLMALPVSDKAARAALGQFLLTQFPIPAKRTHRFVICQALQNLAEPELADGLARLARDKHYASLRGRLCEALARSRHPDAANLIAAVLEDGDDETKLCAIEALGALKASQHADAVRGYLNYQSVDKEWTRAIKKAAEKALKRM